MFTLHILLPILPPMVVLQAHHLLLWFQWWMIGLHPSQCPITQAQCAQLLRFMKSQSITDWINSAIKLLLLMNLLWWILVLNFNLVVLLPISLTISQVTISPSTPSSIDSKHSIFSASIVDRLAFASKDWILDTGNWSYSPFNPSSYHYYFCHQCCCWFTYFGNSISNSYRHS